MTTLAAVHAVGFQPQAIADETGQSTWTTAREREIAAAELQLAHETAEKARSAAAFAKIQLDEFIARHFDDHQLRGISPLPKFRESQPAGKPAVNPHLEQLSGQLTELRARREEMLTRLMPAHPDVLEIDDRIAALSRKLASEHPSAEGPAPPGESGEAAGDGKLAEYLRSERQRHQQSASAYAEVLARCQTAERDLQVAIEGEHLAAKRLAEIKPPAGPVVAMPPVVNSLPAPAAVSHPTAQPQQQSSQPLALAVLLIALVVAAVAAVKLAKSSTDAVFANPGEVSATLALPVVGIIPAAQLTAHEFPAAGRLRRGTLLLAEVLLALLVFVVVAYLVQNPLSIFRICTDPTEEFSRMMQHFR